MKKLKFTITLIALMVCCLPLISNGDVDVLSSFEEKNISSLNDTLRDMDSDRRRGEVPKGGIIMWSGAISDIPSGWVICDGENDTPDLTDRFVLHADADSGGTNDVGDTGGSKTHELTIPEMPIHTHTLNLDVNTGSVGAGIGGATYTAPGDVSNATGSGDAHTNRDLFYALAFIMRT